MDNGFQGILDRLAEVEQENNELRQRAALTRSAEKGHKRRDYEYRRKFGITLIQYNTLFAQQNGCCAICGVHQTEIRRRFAVDHSHVTSEVRGLLCNRCNLAMGMFEDDLELLRNVVNYLGANN